MTLLIIGVGWLLGIVLLVAFFAGAGQNRGRR